jgi:hypothetical protein
MQTQLGGPGAAAAAGCQRIRLGGYKQEFEFMDAEYAAYQESDDVHVTSIMKMCRRMEVAASYAHTIHQLATLFLDAEPVDIPG